MDAGKRRRRRATGPPGAPSGEEPALDLESERAEQRPDDAERYRRDTPPHHDRGV